MSCKRTGIEVTELDCQVCGFCEREYIKKVASFKTIMEVDCPYCKRVWDHIDGLGRTGTTSRICNSLACQIIFHESIESAKGGTYEQS